MVLEEIMNWNEERGNTHYSCVREGSMLQEEVDELGTAYRDGNTVDELDAYCDIVFVAIGSMYKLLGCDKQKVVDALMVVTAANNLKGTLKDENGKVIKDEDFVGPELMLQAIIDA